MYLSLGSSRFVLRKLDWPSIADSTNPDDFCISFISRSSISNNLRSVVLFFSFLSGAEIILLSQQNLSRYSQIRIGLSTKIIDIQSIKCQRSFSKPFGVYPLSDDSDLYVEWKTRFRRLQLSRNDFAHRVGVTKLELLEAQEKQRSDDNKLDRAGIERKAPEFYSPRSP